MLARICSAYPNNGIDCATCPGAADSPHCSLAPTPPPPTPNATNYAGRGSLLLASFSEGHANYATWSTSASKVPSFVSLPPNDLPTFLAIFSFLSFCSAGRILLVICSDRAVTNMRMPM